MSISTTAPFAGRRALLVSPVPTHATTHGNRKRVLSLALSLSELGFDVHLAIVQREVDRDDAAMQAAFGDRLHLMPYKKPLRRESSLERLRRRVRQLISTDARHTEGVDDWYDVRADDVLRQLDESIGFDLAVVEYVFMSRALLALRTPRLKIIDTHDVFANRHRLFLAAGSAPQFYSTTPRDERAGLLRADLVLGIQPQETAAFKAYGVNAITFGHTVTLDLLWNTQPAQWDILLVGSGNEMNVQGLLWLSQAVMPLLLRAMPGVRVAVAGGVCSATPDLPWVVKLGVVEGLEAVYAVSRLVVNPVRSGTGLNIKSVEAMGFGMPLLATSSGARGLEAAQGHAMAVADSPEAFAQTAVALLADTHALVRLSQGAQTFARAWNATQTRALVDQIARYLPPANSIMSSIHH
jgi:glycosyltransferase involved in cell wall biosynthesis